MIKRLVAITAALAAIALSWLAVNATHSAAASYPVVLQTSGGGNTTTATFTTGSDWALRWTFACPNTGMLRVVAQGDSEVGVALVDETGPSGHATMYSHNTAGRHWLVVTSNCQWTLTATDGDILPRA
jgi:hypothetical protein